MADQAAMEMDHQAGHPEDRRADRQVGHRTDHRAQVSHGSFLESVHARVLYSLSP